MTISFTRLFTTQGLYCGALNETNSYRNTLDTRAATLNTQLISSTVYKALVSAVVTNRDSAKQSELNYIQANASAMQSAWIADVQADHLLPTGSFDEALAETVRQMVLNSQSLNACPSTITVASVGSPSGDHTFVFGNYDPLTGNVSDFLIPDTILMQCTGNRSTGGTAYQEQFSLVSKPADSQPTDSSYPTGAGINTTITATDPATQGGLIIDPGFDQWSTNTPVDWLLGTGVVAGTHIFQKSSDDPRGTAATNKSADLKGDGSVIIKLRQAVTLQPNTVYSVFFRVKKVNDPSTGWGVIVRLVDGSFNAVAGPNSYSNSVSSVTSASLASNWTNVQSGIFITPATIPASGTYVEIVFSKFGDPTTAAVNLAECYVDHVSVVPAGAPQYDAGQTLTVFSGINEGVIGDARTATIALVSGTLSSFLIRELDRLIGLASRSVRIPTSGSPTISDGLVV